MTLLLITICTAVALALVLVALLSHHKKSRLHDLHLIGATGTVNSSLSPEGTVLLYDEIWRARSHDGSTLEVASRVEVVGSHQHLLVVQER